MVAPIHTNKRGIYKDLYKEIESNNKKKEASQVKKPRKGIYIELYKQIEFKNNDSREKPNNLYILALKKFIDDLCSKILNFISSATGEVKMLLLAFVVAKKPIGNYIENNLDNYSAKNQNLGIYYNDR